MFRLVLPNAQGRQARGPDQAAVALAQPKGTARFRRQPRGHSSASLHSPLSMATTESPCWTTSGNVVILILDESHKAKREKTASDSQQLFQTTTLPMHLLLVGTLISIYIYNTWGDLLGQTRPLLCDGLLTGMDHFLHLFESRGRRVQNARDRISAGDSTKVWSWDDQSQSWICL